jgi:hypothetical protein
MNELYLFYMCKTLLTNLTSLWWLLCVAVFCSVMPCSLVCTYVLCGITCHHIQDGKLDDTALYRVGYKAIKMLRR